MVSIVCKNEDFIVIYKPPGVPSQSDKSGDDDALALAGRILRDEGERDELYPVHRLDRVVGGLLVFARNKRYAASLSTLCSRGLLDKEYIAVVSGSCDDGVMRDYLYKDAVLGKAFVTDKKHSGAKLAELEYSTLARVEVSDGIRSLVKVKLTTGRFHQIRAQFSSRGYALVGDLKYGSRDSRVRMPALFSHSITVKCEKIEERAVRMPDIYEYPWSLFDKSIYDAIGDKND